MQIIKQIQFQFLKKNILSTVFFSKQTKVNPKMEQEIQRLKQTIKQLENQNQNLQQKLTQYEPQQANQQDQIKQELQNQKEIQKNQQKKGKLSKLFEQCEKKRYAFKLAYIGINYQGIEYQKDNVNTVEYHLFQAFQKTCLVEDIENISSVNYSRSGRTDAGVSALGNVIAFDVRTSIKKDGPPNQKNTIDYVKMLNGVLPQDIRILSATEVNPDFNARFDCNYRVYKYFFHQNGMNIENLEKASKDLLGENDYRNFCKIDVLATTNYVRNILDVKIEQISENKLDKNMNMYCITIKGTAFLWHMIRCIMSVLFSVGEGKENVDIVKQLLDIEKYPRRPGYQIASDLPLILYDCVYENIKFKYDKVNTAKLYDHYREIVKKRIIEQQLYSTSMGFILDQKESYFDQDGNQENNDFNMKEYIDEYLNKQQANKKYHNFEKMPKCDTPEEQIAKLKGKKLDYYNQKLQKQQEQNVQKDQ